MRCAHDQRLWAVTSSRLSAGVELGKRCESWAGASEAVRPVDARQMNAGRTHIGGIELELAEFVIDASSPASDVAVAEILRNPDDREQLHLISRRQSIEFGLKSRVVELRVGRDILRTAGREDRLPLNVVGSGQRER